ncbi:PREDICTED: uncharacterized protein LOC106743155 isoform X2 [Dinoponera quadriceps]|uniref:Uncharacterized protein LOC106743155 isoform X2 n=1 Tax=Dinoponera quadriceps TaxID=609295 RepID=A0A6P3X2Y3_DINQU|nr:PREDICTED: uncharacterized protein LOC106743155 isoform X2 [Dinoponera quadriceps]
MLYVPSFSLSLPPRSTHLSPTPPFSALCLSYSHSSARYSSLSLSLSFFRSRAPFRDSPFYRRVHEMDLLPKHMCHRCSYKLEEFHKFYMDCLKTDTALKSQLSWMRKGCGSREKVGVPMVHIENVNIKTEPLDYDVYELEPIVENLDYINSMANSVAFPAGCIREGLTYAAFSHCRCCCDKDQSRRRTTERLCRNYEGSVCSRRAEIAEDPRRRTALESARLCSAKRKVLARAALQDRDHLSRLNTMEETRVHLTRTETKDLPALNTRDRSRGSRYATVAETTFQAADFSKSTVVRNLRPRINLVNYALNKKKVFRVPENKPDITDSNVTPTSGLELTRQIKVEQLDELEGRTLRPRKNVVDYRGPKRKSTTPELARHEQRKDSLSYRAKRRKLDDVARSSKLQSKGKDTSEVLKLKIKQEVLDDRDDVVLGETTSVTSVEGRAKIADLPADCTVKMLVTDVGVNPRDNVNYFGTNRQAEGEFRPAKKKPAVASGDKNKSKKIGRFSTANYSPKCLRSQDAYLRSGKTRKYDYVEWSMKRLRTRKLMDAVAKNAKKVPAMLKLAESIKHYCETCNVSFMNMELFKLHACYYD